MTLEETRGELRKYRKSKHSLGRETTETANQRTTKTATNGDSNVVSRHEAETGPPPPPPPPPPLPEPAASMRSR
ncbi:hypothetical protein E2C01_061030 [Portunus trituberculatus]|uniref:Uncharacterized protein n=1 Tax=Portunus trituberculatus TaxID=210409 RepID=A0A5B7HB77_PORTR|nr:hypothetical protein [Portunus trituberculatus]